MTQIKIFRDYDDEDLMKRVNEYLITEHRKCEILSAGVTMSGNNTLFFVYVKYYI